MILILFLFFEVLFVFISDLLGLCSFLFTHVFSGCAEQHTILCMSGNSSIWSQGSSDFTYFFSTVLASGTVGFFVFIEIVLLWASFPWSCKHYSLTKPQSLSVCIFHILCSKTRYGHTALGLQTEMWGWFEGKRFCGCLNCSAAVTEQLADKIWLFRPGEPADFFFKVNEVRGSLHEDNWQHVSSMMKTKL